MRWRSRFHSRLGEQSDHLKEPACSRPVLKAGRSPAAPEIDPHYVSRKAMAVSGRRVNPAALRSVLIEDLAQLRDLDVLIGFLDHPSRLDSLYDRRCRNLLSLPLDRQARQIEPAAAERYRLPHPA